MREAAHLFHRDVLLGPDYDLALTLNSGQVFGWHEHNGAWEGSIGNRWVRLQQRGEQLRAETTARPGDWSWLIHYLQTDVQLWTILQRFPSCDPHLEKAVAVCRGLRLLRQDPWECLASFILSSTKQIVQIRQIISLLCQRFGCPLPTPPGHAAAHAFPRPEALAGAGVPELRDCKAGFRAVSLRAAAVEVADGSLRLDELHAWPRDRARERLLALRGVGEKIANCVLLFAYGKGDAFPMDVWVRRALTELYFRGCNPRPAELTRFIAGHFGPQAGYAQQYLFHYMRVHGHDPHRR